MNKTARLVVLVLLVVVLACVLLNLPLGERGTVAPEPTGNVQIDAIKPEETGTPTDQGTADPGTAEPGATDQGTTDPGKADPGTTDPASVDLSGVDLGEDIELGEGITDKRAEQYLASQGVTVTKDGSYTSKVETALYIHTYDTVPSNFVSKTKARNAGWVSSKGNLNEVLPGKSIGGGGYMNESWNGEPLLPETPEGRSWHECDINYTGGYRGAERLVYSEDGLIFYTGDHYESFERLY